ncbi:MAG: PIN domain-containing protein [Acidobacteriia bacterium]|nr:PIN domain-containing protein [Terriglobia bacterium]
MSFPDVNVWLALAAPEHVHAALARRWWERETGRIAFSRISQVGFLRLMTTAAAMGGKPLTMTAAWRVHDRFYEDDRVEFVTEPAQVETHFRQHAAGRTASPKLWADAWLLAFARSAEGTLITFDRALAARGARCLLLEEGVEAKRPHPY